MGGIAIERVGPYDINCIENTSRADGDFASLDNIVKCEKIFIIWEDLK